MCQKIKNKKMSHLQDLTEAHSDNWFSSEIDQSVVSWVPEAFLPDADLIENRVNRFFYPNLSILGCFLVLSTMRCRAPSCRIR
jgi:hypothetical protein